MIFCLFFFFFFFFLAGPGKFQRASSDTKRKNQKEYGLTQRGCRQKKFHRARSHKRKSHTIRRAKVRTKKGSHKKKFHRGRSHKRKFHRGKCPEANSGDRVSEKKLSHTKVSFDLPGPHLSASCLGSAALGMSEGFVFWHFVHFGWVPGFSWSMLIFWLFVVVASKIQNLEKYREFWAPSRFGPECA